MKTNASINTGEWLVILSKKGCNNKFRNSNTINNELPQKPDQFCVGDKTAAEQ